MKDIKIQSIGDIITNSSTEVFTVITEGTIDSVKDIVASIGGQAIVDKFEFKLDYCEAIENLVSEIIESLSDKIDFDPKEKEEETAKRIIASCVDQDIINYHYNLVGEDGIAKPFLYDTYSPGKYKKDDVVEPYDKGTCEYIKENIARIIDDINDDNSWQNYPSLVVLPKDKSSESDKELAEKISNLPYLCDHTASYC